MMVINPLIMGDIKTKHMHARRAIPHGNAPIMGIDRHRVNSDGEGITTLVAFYDCPLKCKFCINPECHMMSSNWVAPNELYDIVKVDDIYFRASKGGITFGGGEPLLYSDFISEFGQICTGKWNINIETSLNVPLESIHECISYIDIIFVDLKCICNSKYISYTGKPNGKVISNLKWLAKNGYAQSVIVRIPNIPGLTDENDIAEAVEFCKSIGLNNIDKFDYILPNNLAHEKTKRTVLGKDICAVLKDIRLRVAKDNGLILTIPECTYGGTCIGTCPRCDAELKTIASYLNVLEDNNIKLTI